MILNIPALLPSRSRSRKKAPSGREREVTRVGNLINLSDKVCFTEFVEVI